MIVFLVFILYGRKPGGQVKPECRFWLDIFRWLTVTCICCVFCAVIVVAQVILSQESFKEFEDDEPVTFVTYEFFEHEFQTTPVVKGTR